MGGIIAETILNLIRGYYWILVKQETPQIVAKDFLANVPQNVPNYLYLKRPRSREAVPTSNLFMWKNHYLMRYLKNRQMFSSIDRMRTLK